VQFNLIIVCKCLYVFAAIHLWRNKVVCVYFYDRAKIW